MKQFFSLVKNENIKTLKQTSYRVLIVIFAVIILMVPAASKLIDIAESETYRDDDWLLARSEDMEECGEYVIAAYYRSQYDSSMFFTDNGIDDRAPQRSYEYEYTNLREAYACAKLIADGKADGETVCSYGVFNNYLYTYYQYVDPVAYEKFFFDDTEIFYDEYGNAFDKYGNPIDSSSEDDIKVAPYTVENAKKALPIFEKAYKAVEQKILNFDLKEYYKEQYDLAIKAREAAEEARKQCEETLRQTKDEKLYLDWNPLLPANAQYGLDRAMLEEEAAVEFEKAAKLLWENVWEYGGWEYNTIEGAIKRPTGYYSEYAVQSPELYKNQYGEVMFEEYYEEYKANSEKALSDARDSVKLAFYSLENGIRMPGAIPEGSVKARITSQLSTIVSITSLIMIVLAGSTLSSEYSTGTIRLLLIRPRKRWKILASKLVSMTILWVVAVVGAVVLSVLFDFVLFGVGDAFVPDLDVVKGAVTVTPSFVGGLWAVLGDMLTSAVVISLAVMLSTLVRRAALSIALPIIINLLAGIVQTVSVALAVEVPKLHWLVYSPLPYTDLSLFRVGNAAAEYLGSGVNSIIGMLFGNISADGFYPWLGVIYLVAFTTIFTILAFVSFIKQQIKN